MAIQDQVTQAVSNIDRARRYTLDLLSDIDDDDWFRVPLPIPGSVGDVKSPMSESSSPEAGRPPTDAPSGATHVAWQVGHLAMAEYALALMRVRDSQPGDREIISREFRRHFGKGSTPDPDPARNPSPAEIRQTLERVHRTVLKETPKLDEAEMVAPLVEPHPMFDTKLGALRFCAIHEYLHAGQIGLLRRLLGKAPLR